MIRALAQVRELAGRLRREIVRLPRQQSEVFCLCHLDGRSNGQIAEPLGIQEGQLPALHKARRQLTASMAKLLKREEA